MNLAQVMFPNVETMFRSDIETMKGFCALAQPEHLVMLKEVEKQFLTEFDFREEARNLELVRSNMRRAWPRQVKKEGERGGVAGRTHVMERSGFMARRQRSCS